MKKPAIVYIVSFIILVIFNVIAFSVPIPKTPSFWIAYGFTFLAILIQGFVWKYTQDKVNDIKSLYLHIPILKVAYTYFIIQAIGFILVLCYPILEWWISLIGCVLIFGISCICLIAADVTKDIIDENNEEFSEISKIETKVKEKVFFIKSCQAEIEILFNVEKDPTIKEKLNSLKDIIKYSDPMTHESLCDLEDKIKTKIEELKNSNDKSSLIEEISNLIKERNIKTKILK